MIKFILFIFIILLGKLELMWHSSRAAWQGIEMLPVADEMVNEALITAEAQLTQLSEEKAIVDVFTNDHFQQLICSYEEKGEQARSLKEQCRAWRNTPHLSDRQKTMLSTLETNLVTLEKLSQKILIQIQQKL